MYTIPLLALEVQSRDGEAYRMFLEGGAKDYDASVLPSLREPLEASTTNDEYKRAKAAADAHDVEHAAFVAARLREAKTPKPLDEGGGMHAHERAIDAASNALHFVRKSVARVKARARQTQT